MRIGNSWRTPEKQETPVATAADYRLLIATLPIVFVAGHHYIVWLAPDGAVLAEFNGLATSPRGVAKAVGYLPSDRLKVHESGRRFYRPGHPQTLLLAGAQAELSRRWQAGRAAMAAINAADLGYPCLGLGRNSNSVTCTLLAAMGCGSTHRDRLLTPGARRLLLPETEIVAIRRRYGLDADDTAAK